MGYPGPALGLCPCGVGARVGVGGGLLAAAQAGLDGSERLGLVCGGAGRRAHERAVVRDVFERQRRLELRQRLLQLRLLRGGERRRVEREVGAPLVAPPPQLVPPQVHATRAPLLARRAARVAPPRGGGGAAPRPQHGAVALTQRVARRLTADAVGEQQNGHELRVAQRDGRRLREHAQLRHHAGRLERRDGGGGARAAHVELEPKLDAQGREHVRWQRRRAHHGHHQLVPPGEGEG